MFLTTPFKHPHSSTVGPGSGGVQARRRLCEDLEPSALAARIRDSENQSAGMTVEKCGVQAFFKRA
ncbi:MAG: hypothetical protein AAFV51_11310, partial [Pseudomonadota bacterium]